MLEFVALLAVFLVATEACWMRRQSMLRKPTATGALKLSGSPSKGSKGSLRLGEVGWALSLGASVTLRLVCTVQLSTFRATANGSSLAAACWVSALASFLSFLCLCLFPLLSRSWNFGNFENLGNFSNSSNLGTLAPAAQAGALALPAFLVVAAVDDLGLGTVQQTLLLVAVLSGFLMAEDSERALVARIFRLVPFACVGTVGAMVIGLDLSQFFGPFAALGVAGASAVAQANALVDATAGSATPERMSRAQEITCHFAGFLVHLPLLLVFLVSGDAFQMPRLADAQLWACIALQGLFYVRSLQPLVASLGKVMTFAVVLVGTLLPLFLLGTLAEEEISARLLNVSMTLFGVLMIREAYAKPAAQVCDLNSLSTLNVVGVANANENQEPV